MTIERPMFPPRREEILRRQIIDPGNKPDIFCSDLSLVHSIGSNRRLIFTIPDVENPDFGLVVAKLIIPAEHMVTMIYMAANADESTVSRQLLAFDPRSAH
jgi:hypothetical protein